MSSVILNSTTVVVGAGLLMPVAPLSPFTLAITAAGAFTATVLLETSPDNVTWTLVKTYTVAGINAATDSTFSGGAANTYVRARVTAITGQSTNVTVSVNIGLDTYNTVALRGVTDVNGNPIGIVNPKGGKDIPSVKQTIKSAIEAASRGNATTIPPWSKAPNWVASTQYAGGAIVRSIVAGSLNNLYLCIGSTTIGGYQVNLAHGTSAASGGPSGVSGAFITDGTVVWTYVGQASSTGTYPLYSTVTPALSTDVMDGYIAYINTNNLTAMGLTNHMVVTDAMPVGKLYNGNLSGNATYIPKNIGTVGTPVRYSSSVMCVYRLVTNANKWIALGETPFYSNGVPRGIKINGVWLSESNLTMAGALINPAALCINLSSFPSGDKVIEIFSLGFLADWLYSVSVGANEFVMPYIAPNNFKIAIEGDSITQISGSSANNHKERIEIVVGEKLGCYNVLNNAVGGTGLISDNSGTATTYLNRLADITLFNPDLLIINGAHNDSGSTSALRQAAMLTYLQAVRRALPYTIIAVFGANLLGGETVANQTAVEQDWVSTIATFNDNNTFIIPVLTANPQLLNSNNDIMFRTDGASPYDIGSGFSHPAGFYYYHTNQLLVEGIKNFMRNN